MSGLVGLESCVQADCEGRAEESRDVVYTDMMNRVVRMTVPLRVLEKQK